MKLLNKIRFLYLAAYLTQKGKLRGDGACIEVTMELDPEPGLPFVLVQIAIAQTIGEFGL